jgi:hypothetical protein
MHLETQTGVYVVTGWWNSIRNYFHDIFSESSVKTSSADLSSVVEWPRITSLEDRETLSRRWIDVSVKVPFPELTEEQRRRGLEQ